jgi:putative Mg2+ transporter-C (MgtC) family protein
MRTCGIVCVAAAVWLLTILSATPMISSGCVETHLPCRHSVVVVIHFARGVTQDHIHFRTALTRSHELAVDSIAISYSEARSEWRFVAVAANRRKAARVSDLALELAAVDGRSALRKLLMSITQH